jgi:RND family efflux transporter MFP subunit
MNNNKFLIVFAFLAACAQAPEDPAARLAALKDQKAKIEAEISSLERELGTTTEQRLRTIAVSEIKAAPFSHYIDLQGRVDADESVVATSKMPGALTRVLVDNGDVVRQGQLIAEIDDSVIKKNLAELEGQLTVATDLYERQKSLWDQKIGSEVQYIQAKNNKESLERSIETMKENWGWTKIYAPTSGTVDMVMLKPGQAIAPGIPLCTILDLSKLKVKGDVTESYVSKVSKGDEVLVQFPDTDQEITTKVSYVSKSINPTNRTFVVECELKGKGDYRANQIAVMKIVDYHNPKAITIPVNLIHRGEDGDFVFVADSTTTEGQAVVRKAVVTQGQNYNGIVEITSGLKEGDRVISTGFQDVNTGETVAVK